jgi:hypothetical protein
MINGGRCGINDVMFSDSPTMSLPMRFFNEMINDENDIFHSKFSRFVL